MLALWIPSFTPHLFLLRFSCCLFPSYSFMQAAKSHLALLLCGKAEMTYSTTPTMESWNKKLHFPNALWLEAKQATEAYETSAQLCAHRGKHYCMSACAVLTALKDWPHRSVITLSQSTGIFSNTQKSWYYTKKGWRDYPSPLTIIVSYVISSTMTSTDQSPTNYRAL